MLRAELRGTADGPQIDVELAVEAGHCLALAGPSGSGKSTILRMLAGIAPTAPPSSVHLGERTLLDRARGIDLPPEERRCGMVFQDYALFDQMSAWRNVAYGLPSSCRGRRRRKAAATELLARFSIAELADAPAAQLSGGERQRVALARAIASDPEMLLLDEPLAALDVRTRAHAAQEIATLVDDLDLPAVLVTHDFFEAALLGEEIAVLDGGAISQRGSAAELAAAPATAFVADFTGANVLRGHAVAAAHGLTEVTLDGGGSLFSSESAAGEVSVAIQPWEIALRGPGEGAPPGSERNALAATVTSVTPVGGRLRVGLALPDALVADITEAARSELALQPGSKVTAVFKAAATRLHVR
jgi:molybdate transport system ATP-binding protein